MNSRICYQVSEDQYQGSLYCHIFRKLETADEKDGLSILVVHLLTGWRSFLESSGVLHNVAPLAAHHRVDSRFLAPVYRSHYSVLELKNLFGLVGMA